MGSVSIIYIEGIMNVFSFKKYINVSLIDMYNYVKNSMNNIFRGYHWS